MLERYFPDPTRSRLRAIVMPIAFVVIIGVLAALLNSRYKYVYGLSLVTWLARYEGFHILAHLVIFSSLVIMVWRVVRSRYYKPLAWSFVVAGTLAIELTQIISRNQRLTAPVVEGSMFDLGINLLGALAAMLFVRSIGGER